MLRSKRKKYFWVLILPVLLGIFISSVKIPYSFKSTAIIYPKSKWSLNTDPDGNFVGEIKNFKSGITKNITNYKFERGDIASLDIRSDFDNGSMVLEGDTIGEINSFYLNEKINKLKNLIAIENAILESSMTGDKPPVVKSLEQKYYLAQQAFDLAQRNFNRTEVLYKDTITPLAEFENAENNLKSAELNVSIAHNDYMAASSGVKPQEIKLIKEQIKSYNEELALMLDLKKQYLITAPLSGRLTYNSGKDITELLSVIDIQEYSLYSPVKISNQHYLKLNSKIQFSIEGADREFTAQLYEVYDKVEIINNQQLVLTKSIIDQESDFINPGLTVQCKHVCDTITIWEYSQRAMRIFSQ